MEPNTTSISAEFLFYPIQPVELPVNYLFETGNYVVESINGTVNPYRQGVISSPDKKYITYIPDNEEHFWDEHLSSDTLDFVVRETHTNNKVNVALTFTRYINQEDYYPGGATLNLPENVGQHIRLELPQFFKYAPFEVTKVVVFDKRIFTDVTITGKDKTSLDLFLNTNHTCYPEFSEIYLTTRHPENGKEAFTKIFVVWSKASFYVLPQTVQVSEPLPIYIISPVMVNNNQSFTITGTPNDAPERGTLEWEGQYLKYTFNLESGYWDEVGKSDMIGAGATNESGMYSGNHHKIIKIAISELSAKIVASETYGLYKATLLIEEELTPDATYTAPYKVSGTIEIRIGAHLLGIPFEGILDLDNPYTMVPDTYSVAEFSGNTLFGGIEVVSGSLTGLTGTIEVDETITFSSGTLTT